MRLGEPEKEAFLGLDYRVFDPEADGKSKLGHVEDAKERLASAVGVSPMLMDTW